VLPSMHPCMGQESEETFLERAKSAFDLALGLGSGRDEVSPPRPRRARWNSLLGSLWSLLEFGPKRLSPSV